MLAHLARRAACALTRPRLAPAFARPPPPGRRALAAAATGLDPPDVRKLAEMAHIDVTDEEVADWEPKIRSIVSWFDELQAVDVDGVAPYSGGDVAADFVTRPDDVAPFDADKALADAPEREGGFVKVPKIM